MLPAQLWGIRGPSVLVSSPKLVHQVLLYNHVRPSAPTLFNTPRDVAFDKGAIIVATCAPQAGHVSSSPAKP